MLINLFVLFISFSFLVISEIIGYFIFVRKYEPQISLTGRLALAMAILTMAGGFVGAFSWWFHVPGSFAWDVPALASRMLAAAGWSFAFLSLMTILRPTFRRLRLFSWMLGIYMWPLTLFIFLVHLDRFDFAKPITYAFFAVVILLNIGPIWFLIKKPFVLTETPGDTEPASTMLKIWLGIIMVITGVWSAALFVTDHGPIGVIWAWKGDPLSSRLIGSMLLTLFTGAVYGMTRRDTARVILGTTGVYGMLLAIASAWNIFSDKPVNPAYMLVFGFIGLVSSLLFLGDLALESSPEKAAPVNP